MRGIIEDGVAILTANAVATIIPTSRNCIARTKIFLFFPSSSNGAQNGLSVYGRMNRLDQNAAVALSMPRFLNMMLATPETRM